MHTFQETYFVRAVIFVRYPITRRRGNSAIFVSCVNQTNFIPTVKNIPWNILERHWAWTKLSCDLQSSVRLIRLHFLCWQRPCAWTLSEKHTNVHVVCRCKNGIVEQNDSYFPAMLRVHFNTERALGTKLTTGSPALFCCLAFVGQITVRKQHRQNSMAFNVHFNCFIDLTINSHTNPYNLASSRLLWSAQPWHTNGYAYSWLCGTKNLFLVHANGTLGDRNFSALQLKRLNRNDIGLRLTPKHPAARERKWKIWYPEWEPKSINRPQITVFGSRGVARLFQRKGGGGSQRLLTSLSCRPPRPY